MHNRHQYRISHVRGEFTQPNRRGFTLIELLVVLGIIAFLASALGVTISTFLTSAKEAQTSATLTKIDGLISERQQSLTRYYDSRDFRKRVSVFHEKLKKGNPSQGVNQLFGLARDFVVAIARKELLRESLPQRFAEMIDDRDAAGNITPDSDNNGDPDGDGIPDQIQLDDVYQAVKWGIDPADSVMKPWIDLNGNGTPDAADSFPHKPETESAELLYLALTRFEQFGIPAVGVDEFRSAEVVDTDGDGLPEFVDGWGRPLRFYRWPTRLVKPFGLLGFDQAYGTQGVDDDLNGSTDDVFIDIDEIGWPGSDDTYIDPAIRRFAALYVAGLPRQPIMVGSPPRPVPGDFDLLNEDSDDPVGVLLDETKRLAKNGIAVFSAVNETTYHTFDTYHKPLVVSAGPDGVLGLYEPYFTEDLNFNGVLDAGEDVNSNGYLDIGWLAQAVNEDINLDGVQQSTEPDLNGNAGFDAYLRPLAALDDLTNRNQRAGQ
jgi:prepilin-type N-terminal cleavage/methylation domain-containing protein